MKMKKFYFIYFLLILLFPELLFAVQTHPHPEGLYVHQFGHVLFILAMLFFLVYLNLKPLGMGRPWLYFKLSLFFFLLWNVNAFFAHWTEVIIPDSHFNKHGNIIYHYIKEPLTFIDIAYYILKLDHFWCVPAMFFMVLALRSFYKDVKKQMNLAPMAF